MHTPGLYIPKLTKKRLEYFHEIENEIYDIVAEYMGKKHCRFSDFILDYFNPYQDTFTIMMDWPEYIKEDGYELFSIPTAILLALNIDAFIMAEEAEEDRLAALAELERLQKQEEHELETYHHLKLKFEKDS